MKTRSTLELIILSFILIISFSSCSKDDSTSSGGSSGDSSFTIKTESVMIEQAGGSADISFNANGNWTATCGENWLTVLSSSGNKGSITLHVKAGANDSFDERNTSVIITCNGVTKSVLVTQKQKDALAVTSNKIEVDADGGEKTIEVKANVNYNYSIDENAKSWISVVGTRALQTSYIVLKIDKNEGVNNRSGVITVSNGSLTEEVTVYQDGLDPVLVISDKEVAVGSSKETVKVEVKSNVEYSVEIPEDSWISENTTRSISSFTHYFDVEANEDYDSRTTYIVFKNEDYELSDTVRITQMQKNAIIVAEDTYVLSFSIHHLDFTVDTNVDFKVEVSADWITQVSTRALQSVDLYFDVAENTGYESRTGTITMTYNEIKQIVTITQEGLPYLEVPSEVYFSFLEGSKLELPLKTNCDWRISYRTNTEKVTFSQLEGSCNEGLTLTANTTTNSINFDAELLSFNIIASNRGGAVTKRVFVKQHPPFILDQTEFDELNGDGDELNLVFRVYSSQKYKPENLPLSIHLVSSTILGMIGDKQLSYDEESDKFTYTIQIKRNAEKSSVLDGYFYLHLTENGTEYSSTLIKTKQGLASVRTSIDYSANGNIHTLQTHKIGVGIPLVIMGDGFVDTEIADGTYAQAMTDGYEYFFDIEPTKSLRDYFDVWYVDLVSKNDQFSDSYTTALNCKFGSGTSISGDNNAALNYAKTIDAIGTDAFKTQVVTIMVVLNSSKYAGYTRMFAVHQGDDVSTGYSVAYVPMCNKSTTYRDLVHHETIGHGFGRLADEYFYGSTITEARKTYLKGVQSHGMFLNVTLESNVSNCQWAHLAADYRYQYESIGCYEGAWTYNYGIYRPTDNSMMGSDYSAFNAVCRELIYKRAMTLSTGSAYGYTYDYADFVEFDKPSWSVSGGSTRGLKRSQVKSDLPPLPEPVIEWVDE